MARLTSEKAVEQIGNRFDLVLVASIRAKELHAGAIPFVQPSVSRTVTALREIEEGFISRDYLKKIQRTKNS
jgi:DNA-directed RNA polymerase subunit omega